MHAVAPGTALWSADICFKPSIKAILPLGTERVKLGLWFGGLAAAQLGQIADAYHYGNARGGGIDTGVEVDVRLFWKIHLVAGAFTTWLFATFNQVGAINIDFNFIADSATDGYFGGYVLVALHY